MKMEEDSTDYQSKKFMFGGVEVTEEELNYYKALEIQNI